MMGGRTRVPSLLHTLTDASYEPEASNSPEGFQLIEAI